MKRRLKSLFRRSRREKVFGVGCPRPLDREAKLRIMVAARAMMKREVAGRHYGAVSAKTLAVLQALLWGFHNAKTGLCFPSYESIATRADCARSTVAKAIKTLEAVGLLTWVNRIVRVRETTVDGEGRPTRRVRVVRTSNAYAFMPVSAQATASSEPSKSDARTGTKDQEHSSLNAVGGTARTEGARGETLVPSALEGAIARLGAAMAAKRPAVGASRPVLAVDA